MKIRMLTGISGADFNLAPKDVTDRFSDGEAVRLMLSDQAEPADAKAAAALAEAITIAAESDAATAEAEATATAEAETKAGLKSRSKKA